MLALLYLIDYDRPYPQITVQNRDSGTSTIKYQAHRSEVFGDMGHNNFWSSARSQSWFVQHEAEDGDSCYEQSKSQKLRDEDESSPSRRRVLDQGGVMYILIPRKHGEAQGSGRQPDLILCNDKAFLRGS